jgi:hypothetical protein
METAAALSIPGEDLGHAESCAGAAAGLEATVGGDGPDCAEPLVILLRSGDLAQPHFLANFRYVTERMARHAGIGRCRFLAVDAAMERYAGMEGRLCLSAS